MKHELTGRLVKLIVYGHRTRVALVERVVCKRSSNLLTIVARLHDPDVAVELDHLEGDERKAWFVGKRVTAPVTALRGVCPSHADGWVEPEDYMEWAEAD